jgi:hypothetical protein
MPSRRIYASWLPPNPRERGELLRIRRTQKKVIAGVIGFLPAGWVVIFVTRSSDFMVPFTVLWLAIGVLLAGRVAAIPCPRCGEKFCEKAGLPYWYGLFNNRCESCGLSLSSGRIAED